MIDAMGFQRVSTNGIELNTSITGRGETMIMLHGFPEFWYSYNRLMAEFGQDHRVVVPDMRGYNLSDKPVGVENYTVRMLVGDVVGLIQAVSDRPVILVAHDWGGAAAWAAASFFPHLISRLIILNSPHPSVFMREILSNPAQQEASQYMHTLSRPDAEVEFAKDGFARLKRSMGIRRREEPDVAKYVEAWSQPGAFTGMLNYYRAMAVKPPDFSLGEAPKTALSADDAKKIPNIRVTVPTLVIWGERDHALLTGNLDGLDAYVPHLQIHRIPTASHWVHYEAHDEVVAAIRAFLAEPSALPVA